MTTKQKTLLGILPFILALIGGAIGAAFAMGADKQYIRGILIEHTSAIEELEDSTKLETTRYVAIMTSISGLGADIRVLTEAVKRLEEIQNNKAETRN